MNKKLTEQRSELLKLRLKLAGGSLKNLRELRAARKDIARILTEKNKK